MNYRIRGWYARLLEYKVSLGARLPQANSASVHLDELFSTLQTINFNSLGLKSLDPVIISAICSLYTGALLCKAILNILRILLMRIISVIALSIINKACYRLDAPYALTSTAILVSYGNSCNTFNFE